MRDPFKIDGPTCISFSGGRTSAYMLWRVLQSNGGLPAGAVVCFANTGKEDPATLAFVQECSEQWSVPMVWVEYVSGRNVRTVDFDTASRMGEPFEALIRDKQYLPNPATRFCTTELKILSAVRYLRTQEWEEWDNLIGMRADEPARVAKVRASPSGGTRGVDRRVPLADAGISVQDVLSFWRQQPFDLALPVVNGKTMHGNCDLCFLKPPAQRLSLIRERPSRAVWWIAQEASLQSSARITDGARFTKDGPSYAQMLAYADSQEDMFDADEEALACFCGD
ncbi:MAG: phosphoadenosine phosphosulfate reductase family protein [Burkholderiales bacterium]|nr:phosphoadenosine phosphosulfate reductase family protein [Burkholderiales bacterium]